MNKTYGRAALIGILIFIFLVLFRDRFIVQAIIVPIYVAITYIMFKNRESEIVLHEQNALLITQQETSLDGIIIVDSNDRIISFNQKFCDIWGIPDEIMDLQSGDKALSYVLPKLIDPEEFAEKIYDLYENKQEKSHEEIPLEDGRILERYSSPILGDDNQYYGRIWYYRDITERKQMEEVVRKSEEQYRTLFEQSTLGMFLHDMEGRILGVNQVACSQLGYSRDELLVMSIFDLHPQDSKSINLSISKEEILTSWHQWQPKERYTFEGEHKRKDGMIISVQISTGLVKFNDSLLILAMVQDITDRKQMEDALIMSEKRLNTMLNNTPDMVVRFNTNLQIFYCNETVERELGIPADFFIGKTLLDLDISEQEAEKFKSMHQSLVKCLETEEQYYDTTELMTTSGLKYYSTIIVPEKNNEGIESLLAVTRDITKTKKMEQEIKESNEKLSSILNNMEDVVWSISWPEFTHDYLSPSLKKLYGRTEQEFLDNPALFKEVTHPDDQHLTENAIKQLMEKGETERECRIVKPDGSIVWVNDRSKMIYDENHQPIGVKGVTRDITERKQMEQELIQRNQEVEHLNQHLNQEIEKAHQIHNNILPKEFPKIEGISFAAFYQPAETLGGDFYEVIQRDNKLVMYLSDISGHGLDGSMINFFVKEAIDSYITLKPEDLTPRSILRHLERQFRRENYPDELFICIFLAVLDLETMKLTYTGAGFQDTPFVKQGSGERVKLSTTGLFINSLFPVDTENFQENTITLTPGSTIFFNTDGLTEQGEPDKFYGNRLPQVFYENAHLSPDEIAQSVVEDFKSFNNDSMQGNDDITFLILQVEPENTRYQLELTTDFLELEGLRKKTVEFLPDVEEADVLINFLYELTANAMEHGNQMDPTKKVMVDLVVSHDFIQVSVEDEGAGFNWQEKIDNPFELEGLTERGRGIAMTRLLCDRLFYNDQGNKVTIVVQLGQGGGVCK